MSLFESFSPRQKTPKVQIAVPSRVIKVGCGGLTGLHFDVERLTSDVKTFLNLRPDLASLPQVGFSHRPDAEDPFLDAAGAFYDKVNSKTLMEEADFSVLNTNISGTYLEQVIHQVKQFSDLKIGRIRLNRLGPKSCFSMHRDQSIRLHIPLKTNSQCYFLFEKAAPIQLLKQGHLYWTNTLIEHSVMNGDNQNDRWHLVFSTIGSPEDSIKFVTQLNSLSESLKVKV